MADTSRVPALLVTGDPELRAALERLAAASGTATVSAAVPEALGRWRDAAVLLVGSDLTGELAAQRPPRRDGVHVVGRDRCGEQVLRGALALGAETVLELPDAESRLVELLADAADGGGHRARVVGVVGGSGGVGASTLAAALALRAASAHPGPRRPPRGDLPVLLVDADPMGGGLERVLGLDGEEGTHWGRLAESAGRLGSASLRSSLPQAKGVGVLGWGPGRRPEVGTAVVRETLDAAHRAGRLVVVDLPRYDVPIAREALSRCDDLVAVSGSALSAVAAAGHLVERQLGRVPVHLVVRTEGAGLLADDVAAALGLPLCAELGHQRGLAELVGLGAGPLGARRGVVARVADAVLAAVWDTARQWSRA